MRDIGNREKYFLLKYEMERNALVVLQFFFLAVLGRPDLSCSKPVRTKPPITHKCHLPGYVKLMSVTHLVLDQRQRGWKECPFVS